MHIRFGFDIGLTLPAPTTLVLLLHARPEYAPRLTRPQLLRCSADGPLEHFIDSFGNHATRLHTPAGPLELSMDAEIAHDGLPDLHLPDARQHAPCRLPAHTLRHLLPSRYCETDLLGNFAWSRFGRVPEGAARVQAVCDYVHGHLRFSYAQARNTRTAFQAWQEGVGVCRDFAHLAITLCRCLNIPARYATGYLGDIGVPRDPAPMDFSAWFEVFLDNRWIAFDARHNTRRIGRIVLAHGRDAADCAFITSYGAHTLDSFNVVTEETASCMPTACAA